MHKKYATPTLKRVRDRLLRDTSIEEILAVVERAEELFYKVDRSRLYSVMKVSRRLLGSTGIDIAGTTVPGDDIRHDLCRLIEDLSKRCLRDPRQMEQPVLLPEDVARQFNVSAKTVSRWRRKDLTGRYFLVEGRKRIGYLERSVERFAKNNPELIQRAARFRQLSDDERQRIVDRYFRLSRQGIGRADAIRQLADDAGCSRETVRNVLKQQRAGHVADLPLEYMSSDEFDRPDADTVILSPTPQPARTPRKTRPPAGLAPYLAELYETPLLSAEQERHLFRKYNYLTYKAAKLREGLDMSNPELSVIEHIEDFYNQAVQVKNQLIRANLRLVVSLAKQRVSETRDFYSLVSDGNISLIRAIEKFDYTRGFKFSTYATWAIVKNFARTIPSEAKQLARFQPATEELFAKVQDDRADHVAEEREHAKRLGSVNRLMRHLSDREQDIIARRFGLDYSQEPQTLQQVGDDLGVSKERIRQLQSRAMEKLREAAAEVKIDLAELN